MKDFTLMDTLASIKNRLWNGKVMFWLLKRAIPVLSFIFLTCQVSAQPWMESLSQEKMNNGELSFFDIQKAFEDYWKPFNVENGYYYLNGEKVKAGGWKQFKRWEWFWENRVDPVTGKFPQTSAYGEFQDYLEKYPGNQGNRGAGSGNWTSMGPSTTSGGYAGLGRLNCVAFHPTDANTIYVGAASGGVWKSSNGGSSWAPLCDENAVLGISDIIVLPNGNSETIYSATGDRDASDNYSVGVLKSIDGGLTWSVTGLNWTQSQYRLVNRLLVDPLNSDILYAATSAGLYKTTDAGATWTIKSTTQYIDIQFKPGNNQCIYGSARTGGLIYRSTDSGNTWSQVYATGGERVQLAVSAAAPEVVYALASGSNDGLYGVYKSADGGTSFTQVYGSTPNLLGWNCNAGDAGGQGWYDLCIAADPTNANLIFIGGVNTWKSTNGGTSFGISNHWSSNCTPTTTVVHADKHFFAYQPGTTTLFECNDGGIYKTTNAGSSWTHLGSGLVISQMYRLGVAQTSAGEVITGLQDCGTKAISSASWADVIGGDGMECFIDYTNYNVQYGELYYGALRRTTNHWVNQSTITSGLTGSAAWVTPFIIDPNDHLTLYVGYQNVFKSTNQGTSWTPISSLGLSVTLNSLAVAPSNSNYIYASTGSNLYRTTNGGGTWTNITGTLPVGSSTITYISVKADDPNTIWVSFGQFNAYKVYQSVNGGASWTNISTGLPSLPVSCVIQNKQNTSMIELYCGTDVGVFIKQGSANWAPYYNNMPNVVVDELDIYYAADPANSRIRAATYGRGLWESPLAEAPAAGTTFAVIGDFGSGNANETNVANLVSGWSPQFVITTGDNRYGSITMDRAVGYDYCEFLKDAGSGTYCNGNGTTINSFFPSVGNHDFTDGGGQAEYLTYFTLPGAGITTTGTSGNERYYDFSSGPVDFFVIDSYTAVTNPTDMTAQKNWLQARLAASTATWKVVYFHHAPYSSGTTHGSTVAMQWPFAAWGADVVLAGHDHTYERILRDGILYFVNGIGGMSLYSFGTPVTGSQFRYSAAYGAMKAQATDTYLAFELYNTSGTLIDSYTLTEANTAPVFTSDPVQEANASEDSPYTGSLADNASDADNDPLTFTKLSGPAWLSVSASGGLTGTPLNADVGLNTWTVQVSDVHGATDQAQLQIIVINTNDPPVFTTDPVVESNAFEGVSYSGSLADNATDEDGDALSFAKLSGPAWLTINADGTLSGLPGASDAGLNTWIVEVSDGNGGTDQAQLQITVNIPAYCTSAGLNTADEWIQQVVVAGQTNTSGNNGGYHDYTGTTISMEGNSVVNLTLTPGFSSRSRFEYWVVWIDYNHDYDFEDNGEQVFSAIKLKTVVNGSFTVQNFTTTTRMRISMSNSGLPAPCGSFSRGEVEDYTVVITEPVLQADFTASSTTITVGQSVTFTDLTTNNPNGWSWTFEGGTEGTSTLQNPTVTYNTAGMFDVSLTATNGSQTDTENKLNYITVNNPPTSYCASSGSNFSQEWISRVVIGSLDNSSGALGYSDFTSLPPTDMQTGGTYPVTLTPGFSNKARFEYWRVWIDINGDFDFDDANEEVFAANNIKTAVTGNLNLPENATPGLTRMRVSMKNAAAPLPCENFARGEVEDYAVNIQPPGTRLLPGNDENITVQPDFTLYPNPASDKLTLLISGWETATTVKVYDITGLLIRHFEAFNGIRDINISGMNPGIYLFIVSDGITLKTRKLVVK